MGLVVWTADVVAVLDEVVVAAVVLVDVDVVVGLVDVDVVVGLVDDVVEVVFVDDVVDVVGFADVVVVGLVDVDVVVGFVDADVVSFVDVLVVDVFSVVAVLVVGLVEELDVVVPAAFAEVVVVSGRAAAVGLLPAAEVVVVDVLVDEVDDVLVVLDVDVLVVLVVLVVGLVGVVEEVVKLVDDELLFVETVVLELLDVDVFDVTGSGAISGATAADFLYRSNRRLPPQYSVVLPVTSQRAVKKRKSAEDSTSPPTTTRHCAGSRGHLGCTDVERIADPALQRCQRMFQAVKERDLTCK